MSKEIRIKYALYDEIHDLCRDRLGTYYFDYDIMKYMLCGMGLPVTSLKSIGSNNNGRVLKLLLEQKLECDKKFKEVVTYIQEKGIKELNLMELDDILKVFPYNNMFFATYFYKCLIGSTSSLHSAETLQRQPINNVFVYYKDVNNFIEDALECGIYDGNYPFLENLYEHMKELGIPFTFTSSKKRESLIKWLHCQIDTYDLCYSEDPLDENDDPQDEKLCYEKTLKIVQHF